MTCTDESADGLSGLLDPHSAFRARRPTQHRIRRRRMRRRERRITVLQRAVLSTDARELLEMRVFSILRRSFDLRRSMCAIFVRHNCAVFSRR